MKHADDNHEPYILHSTRLKQTPGQVKTNPEKFIII